MDYPAPYPLPFPRLLWTPSSGILPPDLKPPRCCRAVQQVKPHLTFFLCTPSSSPYPSPSPSPYPSPSPSTPLPTSPSPHWQCIKSSFLFVFSALAFPSGLLAAAGKPAKIFINRFGFTFLMFSIFYGMALGGLMERCMCFLWLCPCCMHYQEVGRVTTPLPTRQFNPQI